MRFFTRVTGNILHPLYAKYYKITNPIAGGVAIGSASHAMGTAKAL